MIQSGYTKLFGSIVASTIWREETGIDRSRLSSIEHGYVSPRPGEVKQIERFISTVQCQQVARLKRAWATAQSGPVPLSEGKAASILNEISPEGALEK